MNENNPKKELIKELAINNFCSKKLIPLEEVPKYKNNPDKYVHINTYLCEMDEFVNTRILLGIFKCVNFIKNAILAGLICGGIGIIVVLFKLSS